MDEGVLETATRTHTGVVSDLGAMLGDGAGLAVGSAELGSGDEEAGDLGEGDGECAERDALRFGEEDRVEELVRGRGDGEVGGEEGVGLVLSHGEEARVVWLRARPRVACCEHVEKDEAESPDVARRGRIDGVGVLGMVCGTHVHAF